MLKKRVHKKFRFLPQTERMDCGAACLQMIVQYYGASLPLETFRQLSFSGKTGTSFYNLAQAAEQVGFITHVVQSTLRELIEETPFPAIIHWNHNHFVVVVSA
ncbi:MAG: peptidase domain-containing ABC transporter, partial [Dinghuibacter sp.]|nr:peptidase domain-containing ABC transporter [Dinghuibacter sp.]